MRFLGIAAAAVTMSLLATAAPAGAEVAISAPPVANLGSTSHDSEQISRQLGLVTVTGSGTTPPSFVATVSVSIFTTGAGGPGATIPTSSIYYWSGPAVSTVGLRGGGTPGQRSATQKVEMSVPRVAFEGVGTALIISASWNPTLVIDIPASAAAGTYTGTITHSVA